MKRVVPHIDADSQETIQDYIHSNKDDPEARFYIVFVNLLGHQMEINAKLTKVNDRCIHVVDDDNHAAARILPWNQLVKVHVE